MTRGETGQASSSSQGDATVQHHALVTMLKEGGYLSNPAVEAAFRAVPRHLFLPDVPLEVVYADEAIPTKWQDRSIISSSSQPAVMAIMLDQLALQPGDRVLEIGAGTGYNAVLMAHIVGKKGHVVTVDIDEDIVVAARSHLAAAGASSVRVVCGDGVLGYADAAPYDRIILTVGAWDIAPAWIAQLRPGGRLLIPLAIQGSIQKLVMFERTGDHLSSVSVRDGGFMPLRGIDAGPRIEVALGPAPGLVLGLGQPGVVDAGAVYAALAGPYTDTPTLLRASADQLWTGFSLWLATHEPSACTLAAVGEVAAQGLVPDVFGAGASYRSTLGVLAEATLCLLARPIDDAVATDTLSVRCFGPQRQLAQRLIDHLEAWDTAGRPSTTGLRIRAYPRDAADVVPSNGVVIAKKHTALVLDWP